MSVATATMDLMTLPVLALIALIVAALAAGAATGAFLASRQSGQLREQSAQLREQLAVAETRAQGLNDRLRDAHANTERRIELDREEQRVLQQLTPLRDTLGKLERTVVGIEQQRAAQHGQLTEQLRHAARAEEKLRGTAESLASALRSNNTRGLWGETQLRRIIEASGMLEHVDFEVQQHIATPTGAVRPDMVVKLPGGKSIAIDAKVPFDAYLEAQHLAAQPTGDSGADRAARQDELLARHARALRDHVIELSGRDYSAALGDSPEFVIAFVPSESLLSAALDTDPVLLEFAFERRVALASPVSLWAILKSVAFSWRQDTLTSEARTLFELGRELHKRLGVSATHLDKLGRTLSRSVQGYNSYVGSLERQVLPTARKISALNGDALEAAPVHLEDAVRPLTAPELVPELAPD
uniref:DNA recombination protein RmuC n=1 Tax=Leucobacter sp. BZR 635 TaxID=3378705 RepID=UPI003A86EB14